MKAKLLHIARTFPFFLLLLPLFFMLHGLMENYAPGLAPVAFRQTLLFTLIGIAITSFFYLILKSFRKAALVTLFILSFNFFFGFLHDMAIRQWGRDVLPLRYTFIIPFVFVLLAAVVFWLKKRQKEPSRSILFFNLLFLVLILFDLLTLVPLSLQKDPYNPPPFAKNFRNCDTCSKPDVYLVIADEYAGKQELQEVFQFDNSEFEKQLQQRGFHIGVDPRSNYNATVYSMASLFHMDHIGLLGKGLVTQQDMLVCRNIINRNNLLEFFKGRGYDLRNYSFFSLADQPKAVNNYYFPPKRKIFITQTFVHRFRKEVEYNFFSREKFKRVEQNDFLNDEIVDSLTRRSVIEKRTAPRFVYTHFTRPHHPYYVDRNGNPFTFGDSLKGFARLQKEYTEHLLYTNKRLLELIDHIKANSAKPPIIVLTSDHGFRQFIGEGERKYYFMNFLAVHLPGQDYSRFYDGMTTVNTFRVILNSAFGQQLPLAKDSSSFILEVAH
jgi:hypothetical protein